MRLKSESDILDADIRKHIIQEIDGQENLARKRAALRRFEVYKDRIKKHMIDILERELEPDTIDEMISRTSTVNLLKKIVNKKARVYKTSPQREVDEEVQPVVDGVYDFINANQNMKKGNRWLELFKNTLIVAQPKEEDDDRFSYGLRAMPEHLYDVIEDERDPERPLVLIFSKFTKRHETHDLRIEDGRSFGVQHTDFRSGDRRNQTIADSPADEDVDNREFIWWSKNLHFTTNVKGEILADKSPEDLENPIGVLPAVSLHKDQDGSYWATGGEDLIDGTLLVNILLTDMYFIAKLNGFGQFFFFGKNPPKTLKVGPNRGIIHNVEDGDPTPSAGFLTSNPPLSDLRSNIEQAIALLLTTNDLSVNQVSGTLNGANAASGIADLISRSDVTAAVEDDQQLFIDAERDMFDIIRRWHNLYWRKDRLIPKLQALGPIDENAEMLVSFPPVIEFESPQQRVQTVKEKLEAGLITKVRAIMKVNPGMSMEDAMEELKNIMLEKLESQRQMMSQSIQEEVSQEEEDGQQGNDEA